MVNRIYAHPRYAKAFHWGKLISITGAGQIVVQLIGFVCGILVIWLLPTHEYALYTLANTMLGTMVILSDGGISAGVMNQGGKVWTNRNKLGAVIVTGLALRKKFAVVALLIAVPVLLYLLLDHGASLVMSGLIALSLIPVFFASLSGTILEIPLKLKQAIVPLQKNQLGGNVGRLGLTALFVFIFPWAFIAILAGGLPRLYANHQLRKMSDNLADLEQIPNTIIRKDILLIVKRILPAAIYYCISDHISIWLISIFGSTEALAQAGALDRLGMVLNVPAIIFATFIVPRYARIVGNKNILVRRYLQIQFYLLVLSACMIIIASLYPSQILLILGEKYTNLASVVVLALSVSIGNFVFASSYSLASSRGWVIKPKYLIITGILSQLIIIPFVDLSTLKGVYYFSLFQIAILIVSVYVNAFLKINSL